MVFSNSALERALDLQRRSYALLVWMGDAIRKGFILFDTAHAYSTLPTAAFAWLERHYLDIPNVARPAREDLNAFCNLFSTYLESSFDLTSNPGKRLYSPDAHCFCPMCSWLVEIPHLRPKKLSRADKRRAQDLQVDFLRALAAEASVPLAVEASERLVDDPTLREPLALAAWTRALMRRLDGFSDGPAVLALWRGFAWTDQGSPKKKFKLREEEILACEKLLLDRIRNEATRGAR